MTRRRLPAVVGLTATIGGALVLASCAGNVTRTERGPDTFLDVYLSPDLTCDGSPFCVSSIAVNLTPLGEETQSACLDVVPALGYPAQSMDELGVLAGAAIVQDLPTTGVVGIELRAHSVDCTGVPQTAETPVLSGYAEIELLEQDQQLYVPIGCAQPILPCAGSETPRPTPPTK